MMLSKYFNCKMMLKYFNIGFIPDPFHQSHLDTFTGFVLMMQYPVLGMSTLFCEIVCSVLLFIKRDAQVNEIFYPVGSLMNNHSDNLFITDPSSCYQCIICLLYTSPSPRDRTRSRMPSSA